MSGRLIVIDGLDGSGKHTQAERLTARCAAEGVAVRAVSFPDYEQPSSALVKQYLAGEFGQADEVSPYAAASFYAIDRFASYNKFWKNDYLAGHTIIADRYTTSNLFHQMCKLPQSAWDSFAGWMENFEYQKLGLPRPDAVIFLDMHPDVARGLISARYHGDESRRDIHENNFDYLLRCRECALYAAEHCGWYLVNCSDEHQAFSVDVIAEEVYKIVKNTR